ncbi:ubiquitin-like protein 7 [Rhynchophorus ferrugineus]|uniref:Ubiquitin-like protein 7 n=1 Tax=Rhynchophorus ferrugineus TaxID=354439 RepID=A0A834I5R1_RHYFE|nr:hypothetical protein GWI33_014093 [Rhynchophorus ferrugineus]
MSPNIFLGVWNDDKCQRYKVEDIDMDSSVQVLKGHLSKALGTNSVDHLELTFCGLLLDDEKPLSNYGITPGVTVHVIQKPKPKILSEPVNKKITEEIIQEFVSNYRNFRASPSFRSTLHRLENSTELDKVIAAVPGLQDDPVSIAFISKPDLFMQMEDTKTCWQISEKHPLILIAAQYIITDFHQTTTMSSSPAFHVPTTSGHSYSLDALSDDDEEMEGDAASSQGAITAAQLAAALAAASSAPPARITTEMLQQALSPVNGSSRYTTQLRQMRELGLNDENRNLRALTAAQGDLQAAIDLVFSGAFDD